MRRRPPTEEIAKSAGLVNFENYVEERKNSMSNFKLITGGAEPPSEKWLEDMEMGTIFLVIEKGNSGGFIAPCFIKLDQCEGAIKLGSGSIPNPEWVVPRKFRLKYDLLEELGVYKDENIVRVEEIEKKYKDLEEKGITEE